MRLLLVTVGTRGDVEPFIALARAASADGHDVALCTFDEHAALVKRSKANFLSMPLVVLDDFMRKQAEIATLVDEGKLSKDEGLRQGTSSWMTILAANTIPQAKRVKEILDDAMKSGRPFELVVTTLLCCRAVQPHLEARDMPMVLLDLQPGFRPNYHHLPGRSWAYTGALLRSRVSWWFRVLSWSFHQQVVWNSMLNKYANECRVMAGLETLTSYHDYYERVYRAPTLLGYLEELTPTPYPPQTNQLRDVLVQGVFMLDEPREPLPAELEAFLIAGSPPVYVGFGSMTIDAADVTKLVLQAIRTVRARCVLVGGHADLSLRSLDKTDPDYADLATYAKDNVFEIAQVDHRRLLPRCACAVCHAGAGTTAAVLLAGVPLIALPYAFDQHMFAEAAVDAGVSPGYESIMKATPEKLASLLEVAITRRECFAAQLATIQARLSPPGRAAREAVSALESVLKKHAACSMWKRPTPQQFQRVVRPDTAAWLLVAGASLMIAAAACAHRLKRR